MVQGGGRETGAEGPEAAESKKNRGGNPKQVGTPGGEKGGR